MLKVHYLKQLEKYWLNLFSGSLHKKQHWSKAKKALKALQQSRPTLKRNSWKTAKRCKNFVNSYDKALIATGL